MEAKIPGRTHALTSVTESNGLICAFRLGSMKRCEKDVFGPEPPDQVWLHFDFVDSRARAWIEQRSGIGEDARELLLEPHPRTRVQPVSGRALTVVLDDLHHDFRDDPDAFDTIRIYLDAGRIITGRMRPLKTLDAIRRDISDGSLSASTAAELFTVLVDRLASTFGDVITKLADFVDDAEDEVLAGKTRERGAKLGHIRRVLARLRRHLNSNRAALRGIPTEILNRWGDDGVGLKQALDHWDDLAQEAELVQERARLVQEEISSRLNEATNRNLYFISIATALMLPVTLITGIWGMNVGGLPFADHSHGFVYVTVLMAGTLGLALALLRMTRVL